MQHPKSATRTRAEWIARVCHEANRAYCLSLDDRSQPAWEDAPDWQRESAIQGVCVLLDHPGTASESLHESWARQKRAEGWKYGPSKNEVTREHPCLVPFADLPEAQRRKDFLFGAIVGALAP